MGNNYSLLKEFYNYLRIRKKWWLAPVLAMLLIIGLFLVSGQTYSYIQPFIYALF